MFAGDYGERLIFAETVDYLHIYETKTFERQQEIDFIGDLTGFDVFEDKLFIGVSEKPYLSCLMQYDLVSPLNTDINSFTSLNNLNI